MTGAEMLPALKPSNFNASWDPRFNSMTYELKYPIAFLVYYLFLEPLNPEP